MRSAAASPAVIRVRAGDLPLTDGDGESRISVAD
jgi:hypothetical protein